MRHYVRKLLNIGHGKLGTIMEKVMEKVMGKILYKGKLNFQGLAVV